MHPERRSVCHAADAKPTEDRRAERKRGREGGMEGGRKEGRGASAPSINWHPLFPHILLFQAAPSSPPGRERSDQ